MVMLSTHFCPYLVLETFIWFNVHFGFEIGNMHGMCFWKEVEINTASLVWEFVQAPNTLKINILLLSIGLSL